jgi:hypothetical protein
VLKTVHLGQRFKANCSAPSASQFRAVAGSESTLNFPTSRFRMAYDALKETAPSRYTKEYLKLLQLAAEEGEVQVDAALRDLLGKAEAAITVESIRELLAKLDTIPPVTMVNVAPVDLASFDQLCMAVRQ